MSSCTYGCSQEHIEARCANCNCHKRQHSSIHPHICFGKMQPNNQIPSHSCNCPGFVSTSTETVASLKQQLAYSQTVAKELEEANAKLQGELNDVYLYITKGVENE